MATVVAERVSWTTSLTCSWVVNVVVRVDPRRKRGPRTRAKTSKSLWKRFTQARLRNSLLKGTEFVRTAMGPEVKVPRLAQTARAREWSPELCSWVRE